jgi:hypothetical protein
MYKNLNPFMSSSHSGKWLMRGLTLGLVAVGAAVWLRSQEAEGENGVMQPWRFKLAHVKDAVNKAAQKMRTANPSAKEQILDLESELQPGG